jgi:hypothetical protein
VEQQQQLWSKRCAPEADNRRARVQENLQLAYGTMLHETGNTSTVIFLYGALRALLVGNYSGMYSLV